MPDPISFITYVLKELFSGFGYKHSNYKPDNIFDFRA